MSEEINMKPFTKVINPGSTDCGRAALSPVFCKIEWDGKRLSITGVEGPTRNGNAHGSCGQIVMSRPKLDSYTEGWDAELWSHFMDLWDRWHLNDMQAGTPAQMAELRRLEEAFDNGGDPWNRPFRTFNADKHPGGDHYGWAKHVLAGLQPDNGYSYGSAWLTEEVPHEVLVELRELPDTKVTPAWI